VHLLREALLRQVRPRHTHTHTHAHPYTLSDQVRASRGSSVQLEMCDLCVEPCDDDGRNRGRGPCGDDGESSGDDGNVEKVETGVVQVQHWQDEQRLVQVSSIMYVYMGVCVYVYSYIFVYIYMFLRI